MTIFVTGGAGFIGSNFIFHMLKEHPDYRIVCLDKLTYAGNLSTLAPVMDNPNFRFVKVDICDREGVDKLFAEEHPDIVVNFAAESHVDRSIEDPGIFLQTNIIGTATMMDACRKYGVQRYHQVSTDEVYGDLPLDRPGLLDEQRPLRVCMNNGKEFLLFPQDLLAPICDSDFRLILLSAMRYAMGRNTCMPMVVADYIKRHIQLLDDKFLVLAADEIRRYLEDYAEHEPNPNLWQSLLGVLETEQRARATREARKIRPCPACGKPLEIMSIADSWHSPGGFDVIAHCRNCLADYEWFCDKDGGVSDMKQYFFG